LLDQWLANRSRLLFFNPGPRLLVAIVQALFGRRRCGLERSLDMEMPEFINAARDTMSVKRVYGEPYEKGGVTIIPAAKISGGGGGGSGGNPSEGQGMGGGFGLSAAPIGAYVITDGKVTWVPVIDVNRVILGGQLVALALVLTFGSLFRTRIRARTAALFSGPWRGGPRRGGPRRGGPPWRS
jgi:uncharacterized spore protein YtfJ